MCKYKKWNETVLTETDVNRKYVYNIYICRIKVCNCTESFMSYTFV